MIFACFVILLFQLIGEALHAGLHIPVPGPVIGMFILAAVLVIRRSSRMRGGHDGTTLAALDCVARFLVGNMGLLFVPAGVGVVALAGLIRSAWWPIAGALVTSTLLGLVAAGLVMHVFVRRQGA